MTFCGNSRRPTSLAIRRNSRGGRKQSVTTRFVGAVENFRFLDLNVYALADVRCCRRGQGEGLIKSTGRMYRQDYVVSLRATDGKITFLREYFDPVRDARALDTPILELGC